MIRFHPYRKRKPYVLTIFLVLLAVFISFSAVRNLFGVRSILQTVVYPFQYAGSSIWKGITGVPGSIANLRNLSKENAENTKNINELNAKLLVLEELKLENQRLKASLGFKQRNPYYFKLLPAQVVGKAPTPWFSILEINQGKSAGVKKGKPVVVDKGLVGQVVEISLFSSKVILLTDPESSVAAINSRSRDMGILSGSPSARLFMKYVAAGGDIRVGDEIVTSQISTVFPPGVPIGTVTKTKKGEHDLFYQIEVKPAVDFSKIEEVFVVL
ncbi:MAG: rod shape-determining protein MreC [Candidatus Margulisiibacteriota bacterium]